MCVCVCGGGGGGAGQSDPHELPNSYTCMIVKDRALACKQLDVG